MKKGRKPGILPGSAGDVPYFQRIDIYRKITFGSPRTTVPFFGIHFAISATVDEEVAMIRRVKKGQGLTMVELVITLAIIACLATLMMPGLGRWLSHYRIKSTAGDIASCFRLAQMAAVQRNQTASVRFNTNNGSVEVLDGGGATIRTIVLSQYKAQFNGLDFVDQGGDGIISITYNTRGIPSDEAGNPIGVPGGQNGERVFLVNNRGEGYWVEVSPVGNVRYDRV